MAGAHVFFLPRKTEITSQQAGKAKPKATIGAPNMTILPPSFWLSKPSASRGKRKIVAGFLYISQKNPSSPAMAPSCQG